MFELRLELVLSAVSANDFAEAIVMCVCGLNVVDRKSSEVNKGTSMSTKLSAMSQSTCRAELTAWTSCFQQPSTTIGIMISTTM
jgi:hypothetical protein